MTVILVALYIGFVCCMNVFPFDLSSDQKAGHSHTGRRLDRYFSCINHEKRTGNKKFVTWGI